MAGNHNIEFTADTPGERLDRALVNRVAGMSRSQLQALIDNGRVLVDGAQMKAGARLKGGERIRLTIPSPQETTLEAEDIPLTILYEDPHLAVIDKPAGLIVHPGAGGETGTLVHAMLARWPEIAAMSIDEKRLGIVHRLDKNTSGLILIAKTDAARHLLSGQFQARTVKKAYLALLERAPKTMTGRIEAAIGRDPNQRKRMAVIRSGRPAVTEFTVIDTNFRDGQALVEARPLTGRTHQIRVHMAFIGCPVVGDTVYGFRRQRLRVKRHFLHAAELCFDHPVSGDRLCFESPLPPGLVNVLGKLRV